MIVSGTIKDIQGEPLMGANVFPLKNGKSFGVGTVTDSNGDFRLETDEINDKTEVMIKYLGFVPVTKLAEDLDESEIIMQEAFEELDEVVVVANKKPKDTIIGQKVKIDNNHIIIAGLGLMVIFTSFVAIHYYKNGT